MKDACFRRLASLWLALTCACVPLAACIALSAWCGVAALVCAVSALCVGVALSMKGGVA